jgi:ribosomal protein S18 acetylase RimI-like enzyme
MITALSVRPLLSDEWRTYRDLRLHALAESPNAFGRTLAEEEIRSDTDWAARLQSGENSRWNLLLIAEFGGEAIGLAWGRIETSDPDVANLYQMWVAPSHRGLGAGRMLLKGVIEWARAQKVRYLELGVTCGDTPAVRLYSRTGFSPIGDPQPLRSGSDLLAQGMRLVVEE